MTRASAAVQQEKGSLLRIAAIALPSYRKNTRTKAVRQRQQRMLEQSIPQPRFPPTRTMLLRDRTETHLAGKPRRSAEYALRQPKRGMDCASSSTTSDTESLCSCPTTLLPATSTEEKVQRLLKSLAMEEARKRSGPTVRSGAAAVVRNSARPPPSAPSFNLPCSPSVEPLTCLLAAKITISMLLYI